VHFIAPYPEAESVTPSVWRKKNHFDIFIFIRNSFRIARRVLSDEESLEGQPVLL
jgi:hypothetical protein